MQIKIPRQHTASYLSFGRAICISAGIAIGLSGCVSGGAGNGLRDGLARLPIGGSVFAGADQAGSLAGGSVEAPEGAPQSVQSLARNGDAALVLGDTRFLRPPPDAVRSVEGVPVALLAPFSGRLEGPGRALLEGAQMAIFDAGNPAVRLLPFDTGGTTIGAEEAVRAALEEGARLIIGPLLGDNVQAIRPALDASNVSAIAFSNSSRVAGGLVKIAGFVPEDQIKAIVAHAAQEGRQRFAILAPSNEYGTVAVEALSVAAEAFGVSVEKVAFYPPDAMDLSDQIREISAYSDRVSALKKERALLTQQGDAAAKRALKRLEVLDTWGDPPFDALILPVLTSQTLRILSAQLSFYDVDAPAVQILGLQRWDAFSGLQSEPGLLGSRYPAIRSSYREQFATRFAQFYGYAPSSLSSLAYDVTAIAAALGGDGRTPPNYSDAILKDPQGFIGSEGFFRFSDQGVAERGYAILEITPEGATEIQAAPADLDSPLYTPSDGAPEGGTEGDPLTSAAPTS